MDLPDPYENAYASQTMLYRKPGIIFDIRMADHYCLWDKSYPEKPARLTSVLDRITSMGLMRDLVTLDPRKATSAEIELCHTEEHRTALQDVAANPIVPVLEEFSSHYDAIYINNDTYDLALLSAGSTIELVHQICNDTIPSGFAVVRPPGHHAMTSEYCGYCFFNNVAIAAKHAMKEFDYNRILIVDWDVHHGQGTQQMFYDDPRVVYFSIHRFEHGAFWPNLRESDYDAVGEGDGRGFNFNVPLNKTAMTNGDYLAIFNNLLLPMANEYQPELVIISAGYDAALGCPEGEMKITPAFYAHMLWSLKTLAKGRLAVVLEGGYCLESLAEGAALTARALIGSPCPPIVDDLDEPSPDIIETVLDVIHAHQNYWNCFIQKDKLQKTKRPQVRDKNPFLIVHKPSEVIFLHDGIKAETFATQNCYPVQSPSFLNSVAEELLRLRLCTTLTFPSNKVAFVYDKCMMLHEPQMFNNRVHPEDPHRISATYTVFMEHNIPSRCRHLPARMITKEELLSIHSPDHINKMYNTATSNSATLRETEKDYDSVSFCSDTFQSACYSAGSLLELVDEVLQGKSQAGVAVIRPPGHHASADMAHGFCYFNNVALAAKYARDKYHLDRILILDWDVHHGNGTQDLFYNDKHVLYISIHVFKNASFFPNLERSDLSYVGEGEGKGFNVNIPWANHGVGDADYLTAFYNVILPIAYQYNPQLVLISAGFDAAILDPIGKCNVTPQAFGHFTHYMSALANGKVIVALEGGYNKESVSMSMVLCTKALLSDPMPLLEPDFRLMKEANTIRRVVAQQRVHWKCVRFDAKVTNDPDDNELNTPHS